MPQGRIILWQIGNKFEWNTKKKYINEYNQQVIVNKQHEKLSVFCEKDKTVFSGLKQNYSFQVGCCIRD